MKQICTLIAALCLLVIAQNLNAQNSVSVSIAAPSPLPTFGAPDSVKSNLGFTSTNTGTFNEFAKAQTDTIISPSYYYTSIQSDIYFVYNFTVANPGSGVAPEVLIITAAGDTTSATATTVIGTSNGGVDYYFSFHLSTPLPANTNFKIAVIIADPGKTVRANTLKTNALKATGQGSLPLPVTFTGFYAKNSNGYTSLTWNIATESNVAGYEVQRSIDGSNFSKIGFVAATNSSSYNFIDSKAGSLVYYRIKSIDVDGKYSYSIIVNIKGLKSDVVMKAFPMPVQNELTVQHNAANSNSKLEIISTDGRMIEAISLAEGSQQTKIDLSSAKSGIYVVRFVNGLNIQTSKIVKQ